MKKRLLALTLALLFVLSLGVCAHADESVSGAKNGVAVLATFFKGESDLIYVGNGSCFFIGVPGENPQYILTNHHVIESYLNYGAGMNGTFSLDGKITSGKMILRVYYDWNSFEEAYYVTSDKAQDIAVLRLAKPTDKRVVLPLCENVNNSMVGDSVHAIGYPVYADIVDSTSTWSAEDSLVTNGSISRLVTESGTGAQWIEIAATEWGSGNSGGPVVTNDGVVVGIVSHSQSYDSNTIYKAVNINSVLQVLKNNGVSFAPAGEKKQTAAAPKVEPAPVEAPVSEAPAVETAAPPVQTAAPAQKEDKSFEIEPWMYAAGGGVLLAIVLLAVLLRKKPAPAAPSPAEGKGSVVQGKQTAAFIRSLAAQHGGLRVQVGSQPVVVGRQADCAVRFQSGTPGVSAVHCQVTWDAARGEFVLTDLKSSYGTFLETGQRLAPHTPVRLRNGDSFYVGDKSNILRVETAEV